MSDEKNTNADVFDEEFFIIQKCSSWLCVKCLNASQDWKNDKCSNCNEDQSFSVVASQPQFYFFIFSLNSHLLQIKNLCFAEIRTKKVSRKSFMSVDQERKEERSDTDLSSIGLQIPKISRKSQ